MMMVQCFEIVSGCDHCEFSFHRLMMMTIALQSVVVFVFVLIGSGFLWLIFLRCVKNTDYERLLVFPEWRNFMQPFSDWRQTSEAPRYQSGSNILDCTRIFTWSACTLGEKGEEKTNCQIGNEEK